MLKRKYALIALPVLIILLFAAIFITALGEKDKKIAEINAQLARALAQIAEAESQINELNESIDELLAEAESASEEPDSLKYEPLTEDEAASIIYSLAPDAGSVEAVYAYINGVDVFEGEAFLVCDKYEILYGDEAKAAAIKAGMTEKEAQALSVYINNPDKTAVNFPVDEEWEFFGYIEQKERLQRAPVSLLADAERTYNADGLTPFLIFLVDGRAEVIIEVVP